MFLHTFLLVFLAEMADKTQLMIMALCNKYKVKTVVIGMALGIIAISALSVCAGDLIGDFIPISVIKLCAAAMFLGFGLFNLKSDDKEEEGKNMNLRFPFLSIAFTFMLAELGDKTQLATVAIAADHMDAHLAVFAGGALGLFMANLLGIFAGKLIFSHISEDAVKIGSSFFFFLFGSITLFEAITASFLSLVIYSIVLICLAYFIYMRSRRYKKA